MVTTTTVPSKHISRTRKAHTKSRQGCSNCKLRRVKCDEGKPGCKKCNDYGVACKYGARSEQDLQLSVTGEFMVNVPSQALVKVPSLDDTCLSMINHNLVENDPQIFQLQFTLSEDDLVVLKKFQTQTVCTIGTADTFKTFQAEILRLASCHPFLMHILLTMTLMHHRYDTKQDKLSVNEAFHWYRGTSLFNSVIARHIEPNERDAVWACAALLGVITFGAVDAKSPEQAWPLAPANGLDLDWLSISDGKKEIVRLAYPNGPESAFYFMSCSPYVKALHETPDFNCDFAALPPGFTAFVGLTCASDPETNPYHKPAAIVNELIPKVCTYSNILRFFVFIRHLSPEYRKLLEEKDPVALLILAYWYATLCDYQVWWVQKRAAVECQAICIYLRRYHWQNSPLMKLLKFPSLKSGVERPQQTAINHWMFPGS